MTSRGTTMPAMDAVAPDGSPVDVYLALPAEPELGHVRSVLSPGSAVLDLGCGVGRLSNPLAADGHEVVAVDESAEMLAHVIGPEAVLADLWHLDLGRRFDVVLATSHLSRSVTGSLRWWMPSRTGAVLTLSLLGAVFM